MQIFNDAKKRIGTLTGFRNREITRALNSGDKELVFEYPAHGEMVDLLKEEFYIRTKTDEFVLRAVEKSADWNKYTAQLNVEELEGQCFPYGFALQEQTIRACLEFAFEGTGWKVGTCAITKKRTIDIEESTTAWSVLQDCLSTYRVECDIDTIKKTVNIYEMIGQDRGRYFMEGLNLRKLTINSDTYEFYTRIIPIGKDGITIEWLNGKEYLENYQYSKKIKTYTWKDERYTNTTSLMEDAAAKLDEMSRPYKAYAADVIDLAAANPEYSSVLDYGIGDTVTLVSKRTGTREKQRIVKITEHPETPEKNTVELSNVSKTFAEVQKSETELAKQEAISIANSTTKKVLQDNYYNKQEVESHITASAEKIALGVSETYATKTSVTEKYNDAVKAGQEAADAAEEAANAATDEKLTEYSTTEEMKSAIELTTESILQQVKHVEESSMHDYAVNGNFADGLNNWNTNGAGALVVSDTTLGTAARILRSTTSTCHIRQTLPEIPAGRVRVRYKAATETGYESTARVRLYVFGSQRTTGAGLLKSTEWVTVEHEFDVSETTDKLEIYFYAETQGAPVFIKDVEVLGKYSLYAEAQLKITENEITNEVSKKVDSSEFGTLIAQNAYHVKIAWNKSSSYIQFEETGITLYNGAIEDNQKRTVFDYMGTHFYLDGYHVGKIGTNGITGESGLKGLTFELGAQAAFMTWSNRDAENVNEYMTKWTYCSKQCGNYEADTLHAGTDIDMHFFKIKNVKWENGGINATIEFVQVLAMNSNGTIARWGEDGRMVFKNGILTDLNYYAKG